MLKVLTKKGLCHRYNLMGKLKGLNLQQDSTSSEECNEDTVPDKVGWFILHL